MKKIKKSAEKVKQRYNILERLYVSIYFEVLQMKILNRKERIVLLLLCLIVIVFAGCRKNLPNVQDISDLQVRPESVETPFSTPEPTQPPTAEPTPEPTPEPTTEPAEMVSILMVGDILLHTPVENAALQEDGSYSFEAVFAQLVEEIRGADLAIVNQEVIIGGEELGISGYPAFNAPFAVGDALAETGFDVICHGTNHALDKGKRGLLNCIDFWRTNYPEIAVLGIHDSQESQDEIYIYEQGDIRIAILNYTYGTNGIQLPSEMPYAVDLLDKEKVIRDIQKAEELADFTIVCPHWGTEYQLEQSAAQEQWALLFAENGVDLVLGTHPHVIQPIEWVQDAASGHRMLVYYSLGNFVNWTSGTGAGVANRMVGGMAQVTLTQGANGIAVADYGVEPIVCHLEEGINGVAVYKLADYTKELAERNQIRLQDGTFSREYCEELCEKVWGD